MTLTLTIIDDQYSANLPDGTKTLRFTASFTNPYTAGGDAITTSTYFPNKFLGGYIAQINPSVSAANAGVCRTGTLRSDTSSTTTAYLQLWNAGLSGTSSAGLFVDNTVANVSNITCTLALVGY